MKKAILKAAAGEFVRFEAAHPDIYGKLRLHDTSLNPLLDENGNVTHIIPEARDITEKVAQKLSYDCVSREDLLESSKQFNIPEIKLHRAIEETTSILDRFMRERKKEYLFFLQTAILKHVQKDNVVGHGYSGHLLIKDIPHVIKVRINVALEDRIKLAMEREGMSWGEAFRFLNKLDTQRKKWGRRIFGVDIWDSSQYDLVLQINKITVDDAVDLIYHTAELKKFDEIKWLNIAPKQDKEFERRDDIVFLSEIITNSMYWQGTRTSRLIIKRLLAVFSQKKAIYYVRRLVPP